MNLPGYLKKGRQKIEEKFLPYGKGKGKRGFV